MKNKFLLFCLPLFLLLPLHSAAQMFSVDDDGSRERVNPYAPYLRVGIKPIDFSYTGSAVVPAFQRYDLSATAAHIRFESMGFDIGLSFANSLTGLEDKTFLELGIKFANSFMIVRQQQFGLGIPLQLGSDLTTIRNEASGSDFSQTNLSIGAGAFLSVRAGQKIGLTTQFIPAYGFSSSSGGFFGGNVFSLRGKARLNFYNILFGKNLSLGYDYESDSYDIEGEEFDYDFEGHTITIGVSF